MSSPTRAPRSRPAVRTGTDRMARSKADRRTGRLFRHPSGQSEMFEKSREELAEVEHGPPVECLGLTFEDEDARRAHFLAELQKGLEDLHAKLAGVPFSKVDDATARMAAIEHWPMGDEAHLRALAERMAHAERSRDLLQRWKDEVGFPDGTIDDILALSDPPWHTACPNPFLGAFMETHGRSYDPAEDYRRKPFAVDVSEGKTHPVYRAHGYHTKVPHLAIVPSILHYTEPGDLVLDGFAGSGMTGVAAQWCGTAPESYRKAVEARWTAEGFGKPKWGSRRAVLNDLSPAAGFIAANYTLPFDVDAFAEAAYTLLDEVEEEFGWMYQTMHIDGKTKGRIDYTVWSEVFSCPECADEIVFVDHALDEKTGRVKDVFSCPHCNSELTKRRLERLYESHFDPSTDLTIRIPKRKPILVAYSLSGVTYKKKADAYDLKILERIAQLPLPLEVPVDPIPHMHMTHQRARMDHFGITHIHHFFLPRATHALAALWCRANDCPDFRIRRTLIYFVEQSIVGMTLMNRHHVFGRANVNQHLTGVYYIPSIHEETSYRRILDGKLDRLKKNIRVRSSNI